MWLAKLWLLMERSASGPASVHDDGLLPPDLAVWLAEKPAQAQSDRSGELRLINYSLPFRRLGPVLELLGKLQLRTEIGKPALVLRLRRRVESRAGVTEAAGRREGNNIGVK